LFKLFIQLINIESLSTDDVFLVSQNQPGQDLGAPVEFYFVHVTFNQANRKFKIGIFYPGIESLDVNICRLNTDNSYAILS